jgi:hypothetical protein
MGSNRVGKIRQMKTASKYFLVPQWHIGRGAGFVELRNEVSWVSKVLAVFPVGSSAAPATVRVNPDDLDLSQLWFLQEEVDALADITVVFAAGRQFAFSLDRSLLDQPDWRTSRVAANHGLWRSVTLSRDDREHISSLMGDLALHFGRLDFLKADDRLFFLEVNCNGQWAWLDQHNEEGLLSAVVDSIIGIPNG